MRSPVAEALVALSSAFDAVGVRWYLFGAQAALVYGAARLTADIDVTVALGAHDIATVLRALETGGFVARGPDVEAFAERTRVIPTTHRTSAIAVDVVIAGPGLEEMFLQRAQPRVIEDVTIPVASAEDIVIMKIIAGRAKDIDDVVAILAAHPTGLDLAMVRDTLRQVEEALDRGDLLSELACALQHARE